MFTLPLLLKFLKSKDGIYLTVVMILLLGLYSWHTGVVRRAQQDAKGQAYSEMMQQREQEYKQQFQTYQTQIQDINSKLDTISKQKASSTIIVQKAKDNEQQQINKVEQTTNTDDLIKNICSRIKCND